MSNEYLSNDFPAPIEVCKCGRYASIDCMIAVSDGYKCISCVEKELHDRIPKTVLDEVEQFLLKLENENLDPYYFNNLDYILSKYRKEENE